MNPNRKETPSLPTPATPSFPPPPNYGTEQQLNTPRAVVQETPENLTNLGQYHGHQLTGSNFMPPSPYPGGNVRVIHPRPQQQPEHPRDQTFNSWAPNYRPYQHPHNMAHQLSLAVAPSPSYLQTHTPECPHPCRQSLNMSVTVGSMPQLLPPNPRPPHQAPQSSSKRGLPSQPSPRQNTSSNPQHPNNGRAKKPRIQLTTTKERKEAKARRLPGETAMHARGKARGRPSIPRPEVQHDVMWSEGALHMGPTQIDVNREHNRHDNAPHSNGHGHDHDDGRMTTCPNEQNINGNQNQCLNKLVHQLEFPTDSADQDMERDKAKRINTVTAPYTTSPPVQTNSSRSSPAEFSPTFGQTMPSLKLSTQPIANSDSESIKESDVDLKSSTKGYDIAGSVETPHQGGHDAFTNSNNLNYAQPIDSSNALFTDRNENSEKSSSSGAEGPSPHQSPHRIFRDVGNNSQNCPNKHPGGMEGVKEDSRLDGGRGHSPDSQPLVPTTHHPSNDSHNQQLGQIGYSGSFCGGVARTPNKTMKTPQNARRQSAFGSAAGFVSHSQPDWAQPLPGAPERCQQLHTLNKSPVGRPNVDNIIDNVHIKNPTMELRNAQGKGPGPAQIPGPGAGLGQLPNFYNNFNHFPPLTPTLHPQQQLNHEQRGYAVLAPEYDNWRNTWGSMAAGFCPVPRRPYVCDVCGVIVYTVEQLQNHKRVVHDHGHGQSHGVSHQPELMLLEQHQRARELSERNAWEDQVRFQDMHPNFPAHFQHQPPIQQQGQERTSCCVCEPSVPRPNNVVIERVDQRQQQEQPPMCIPISEIIDPMDRVRLQTLEELGICYIVPLSDSWSSSVLELRSFINSARFNPT